MKRILILFSFALLLPWNLLGQDIHFSQFYNLPALLNPSLAGLFRYDYRLTVGYRNQWKEANATYESFVASADMNFVVNPITNDKLGVGLAYFNDQLGIATIINNTVIGNISYHKILDKQKRNRISIGLQGCYVNKALDYSKLIFGNQIDNYQINTDLSSGEQTMPAIAYFNLHAGIGWLYKASQKIDIRAGVSFFNIVSPRERFIADSVQSTAIDVHNLKTRPLVYLGMDYLINERWSLHPDVMYIYQSQAQEFNLGLAGGYALKNTNYNRMMVLLGFWYRTGDAIILMSGFRYKNYNFCFTYDHTISDLRFVQNTPQATGKAIGAYEFTFTYMGLFKRAVPGKHTIPCGIF